MTLFRVALALFVAGILCLAQARPGPDSNYNISTSGGGGSFSLVFGADGGSAATTTTIDYGTLSYGSGCNAVVIGIMWYASSNTDTVSSVSVGGSASSQISGAYVGNGNVQVNQDIWEFVSPSGTSADFQVTYSHAPTFNSSVGVYCLKSSHTTATNGYSNFSQTNGTVVSVSATVPSGGGAVVIGSTHNGATITWTNATQDAVYTGGSSYQAFAHASSTGTITISNNPGASDAAALSVAAFQP